MHHAFYMPSWRGVKCRKQITEPLEWRQFVYR